MVHGRARFERAGLVALAGVATGSLLALSAAPGAAAAPVAQASASAISATIAGQTRDSGSYQAVNDGTKESTSGSNAPAVTVLGGQSLISAGTLAQDATTSVTNGKGHSAACAGLAGPGATAVSAGDAGSCLSGGQAVTLQPQTLDLSKLTLVSGGLLPDALTSALGQATQPLLNGLVPALQSALQQALTQLGLSLDVSLGAVQSNCVADPGSASGTAHLAGAGVSLTIGGQKVNLVNLPVDPAPNTHVATDGNAVAKAIEDAVSTQLNTVLTNQLPTLLGGLGLPTPPTVDAAGQAAILNNALQQITSQLAPLQANLIDATLNLQSQASPDQITVTALDLKLLPAAQQFGVNAFELQVGTSKCGPSGEAAVEAASASPTPTQKPSPKPTRTPRPREVPTSIPSGEAHASGPAGQGPDWGLLALGGLVTIGVGAAGAAWSASRSPR